MATIYTDGKATVIIHYADITPEERKRRIEQEVKPALSSLGRAAFAAGVDLTGQRKGDGEVGRTA